MMRYIISLSLALTLTSCWNGSDDGVAVGPQACPFEKPLYVPEYKLSPYPDTMNTGLNQEKLVYFMSLATSEAPCYLATTDGISVSQVPSDNGEINPEFAALPVASGQVVQNWRVYSEGFKNNLMGLTTMRISGRGADEKISTMSIAVRSDARRWHLWHEYTHALIGQARAANKNQNLSIPSEGALRKKFTDLVALDRDSEEYATGLQELVQAYRDWLDKSYIDEMLIESTLIDLTRQFPAVLEMTGEDYARSVNAIDFFMQRYDRAYKKTRRTLNKLLADNQSNEANKMTVVRALVLFGDQHRRITEVTEQATDEIDFSEFGIR
jgi:hypothetical protein